MQDIQQQQLKGGIVAAFAGGGLVDPDVLSAAETGGDISNWVAKTFRGAIETGAQKTMRLMKEMKEIKEKTGSGEDEYDDSDGGGGGGAYIFYYSSILGPFFLFLPLFFKNTEHLLYNSIITDQINAKKTIPMFND